MDVVVLAAIVGTVAAGAGLLLRPAAPAAERVVVAFPPDLSGDQVEVLLGTVAGLPARARVAMEVEGADGRLAFAVEAAGADLRALQAALHGAAPGLRFEPRAAEATATRSLRAWVGWRGSHVLLRRDQPELSVAALLGVLRHVGRNERVQLRVRLRPVVRPKAPPLRGDRKERGLVERVAVPVEPLPADQVRQIRNQYGGPLLNVRLEIVIWAASLGRARQLLARVVAVLRARSGVRGRFFARSHRFALSGPGVLLAPTELVPLIGWPLEGPDVPGLEFVRSPRRLPDAAIPRRGGRCFGVSTWPGLEQRELHQPVVGTLSHSLVLGPTGSGKSSLLARLLLDDVEAGRGVVLLDMKGDTALDVLERIPERRHGDVVVLDPADSRSVPGLKAMGSQSPDLTADLWVGLFRNLFAESWGVRSERYIRLGVQTLALDPTATITELARTFHDRAFRTRLLATAPDPLLSSAWASFDSLSAAQQAEHIGPGLSKVQDVINRRVVRAVLGQAKPKITLADAMQTRKIVVMRLSPGLLGPPTAQLLGGLVVYELYQAVMARQAVAHTARRPFGVYIDEPAVMQLAGVPLDALYELARGLGVGITTATQSVHQLPPSVQRAVLTNAATIATFRTGRRDAVLVAGELVGVDADQLQHLGQYEIAVRLGLRHGQTASVATARTLPLPDACADLDRLRDASAERYGVPIEATDAAMQTHSDQPTATTDDVPIGRRRRPR